MLSSGLCTRSYTSFTRLSPTASALAKSASTGLLHAKFQSIAPFLPGGSQLPTDASTSTVHSKKSVPLYENEVSPQISLGFTFRSKLVTESVAVEM